MEGSSFGDEFPDVIRDDFLPNNTPVQTRSGKGMATFVYTEMIKQLEQAEMEIASWCGEILQEPVSSDLVNSLRDGTVLCQIAQYLYPTCFFGEWIPYPQSYEDYAINLDSFARHCIEIGIHQDLLISEQHFNDNDLAKLITCLLEYKERYYTLLKEQTEQEASNYQPTTLPQPTLQEHPVEEPLGNANQPLLPDNSAQSEQHTCCACCGCAFL